MSDVLTYGVFLHSSGEQGGYVVRTIRNGWCAAPYNAHTAVKIYKRKAMAQTFADALNASPSPNESLSV